MKPWFIREDNVVPFPKKDKGVVRLPNVNTYPDFLTGVQDLQNHLKNGDISSDIHKKLYQDLIHRFMKVESFETPWFIREAPGDRNEYINIVKQLQNLGIKFNKQPINVKTGRPMNIRATGSTKQEVQNALKQIDPSIILKPSNQQLTGSKTYEQHMFNFNNKDYYILTRALVTTTSGNNVQKFSRKELTPKGLGLAEKYNNLRSLTADILNKINAKYKSPISDMLKAALDNGLNYQNQKIFDQQNLQILNDPNNFKSINQDFGETIAPLLLGQPADSVEFPVGNEPLIDVKLPGRDISIKALTGSGNAFTKIKNLFSEYEKTINKKDKMKQAKFQTLSIFANEQLSVIDSILLTADQIQSPEMVELTRITGKMSIKNQQDLTNALQKIIMPKGRTISYKDFINTLSKIGGASKTKIFGIPRGGSQTGPSVYKAQPLKYAVLTITYAIGKGVENVIVNGVDKAAYSQILQDIMKQVKAEVGIIGIDKKGIWSVSTKPFSSLNFKFDYHAYTSNPGNNRPGFAIVR